MKHHITTQKKTKRPVISANTFTSDKQTENKPVTGQYSIKSTAEKKKDPDISPKSTNLRTEVEKQTADEKKIQQPKKSVQATSSTKDIPEKKKAPEIPKLGKLTLKKDLKSDAEKIVVLAEVDGKDRVLKVSAGQGALVAPNVLAAQWIQRLALDSVTAPEMQVLNDEDIQRIVAGYKLNNQKVGEAIETAIQKVARANIEGEFTGGLMAEVAPESVDRLVPVRAEIFEASDDPRTEIEELLLKVWPSGAYANGRANFIKHLDNGDYDKALGMTFIKSLGAARHEKEGRWRLAFLLTQIGGDKAAKAKAELKTFSDEDVDKYTKFTNWLDGAAGTGAIIQMACTDLLLGMDDRVVSSFHPGNFSFANGKLWCIDNAKIGPDLVNGSDEEENFEAYKKWAGANGSPFETGSLVEHLRNKILETGLWGLNPNVTIDMVESQLTAVLFRAAYELNKAAILEDAPEGADRIKLRVNYLEKLIDDQKDVTESLRVCEQLIHLALSHEPPEIHSTKSLGKKVVRTFSLWTSSSVEKAHEAKEKLRKAKGLSELKDRISAAESNLEAAKTKKEDQAYAKAKLELEAAQFAHSLSETAALLTNTKSYKVSRAERNAVEELYRAWQNSGSDLQIILTEAKKAWDSAVTSDEL
jgi:hypothetical protein